MKGIIGDISLFTFFESCRDGNIKTTLTYVCSRYIQPGDGNKGGNSLALSWGQKPGSTSKAHYQRLKIRESLTSNETSSNAEQVFD